MVYDRGCGWVRVLPSWLLGLVSVGPVTMCGLACGWRVRLGGWAQRLKLTGRWCCAPQLWAETEVWRCVWLEHGHRGLAPREMPSSG